MLALYCNTHTDCKQQHFLTRKQTQNPPIKPSFNPAGPYSACFPPDSFFFFLSLKGSSAVWWMSGLSDPPRFFGPALTFCWAKNKVHRVHTESFAALIPRKWNFTPNPKQTRPHISSHYLNELIEYRKSYQVDIQCTVSLGSLIYWSVRQNSRKLCEWLCLRRSHSRCIQRSQHMKQVSHLTLRQSKSSTLITQTHYAILFFYNRPLFHLVK